MVRPRYEVRGCTCYDLFRISRTAPTIARRNSTAIHHVPGTLWTFRSGLIAYCFRTLAILGMLRSSRLYHPFSSRSGGSKMVRSSTSGCLARCRRQGVVFTFLRCFGKTVNIPATFRTSSGRCKTIEQNKKKRQNGGTVRAKGLADGWEASGANRTSTGRCTGKGPEMDHI